MRELRDIKGLHPRDLTQRQRLLVLFVVGLILVVLFYTLVYNWGMRTLENDPQSIFRSLNTVVETMTTTGYGADSPWATPVMNVLMMTMQLTGIIIGFVTLRVLVIPLFERTPLNLADRLTTKNDHVVIAEYQHDTELLLDELEELDIDYVLIESDEEEAKRLSDDGYQAIKGDPEERADLDRATISFGGTISSLTDCSPIWNAFITSSRRSSERSPSSRIEPSRFQRSARDLMTSSSVSSQAPVISMPKSLSVSFAIPSPSVMTGEISQWNQYNGVAPYRQTIRDRSTPRYVGVCSSWVRWTRLIMRKVRIAPLPIVANIVFAKSGSKMAASAGSTTIPTA